LRACPFSQDGKGNNNKPLLLNRFLNQTLSSKSKQKLTYFIVYIVLFPVATLHSFFYNVIESTTTAPLPY
jgi:hypothetical protein